MNFDNFIKLPYCEPDCLHLKSVSTGVSYKTPSRDEFLKGNVEVISVPRVEPMTIEEYTEMLKEEFKDNPAMLSVIDYISNASSEELPEIERAIEAVLISKGYKES